jgi:hypothetical protein
MGCRCERRAKTCTRWHGRTVALRAERVRARPCSLALRTALTSAPRSLPDLHCVPAGVREASAKCAGMPPPTPGNPLVSPGRIVASPGGGGEHGRGGMWSAEMPTPPTSGAMCGIGCNINANPEVRVLKPVLELVCQAGYFLL